MTDYLAEAVALAERAAGNTFPNPLVGAIVERDGIVLGRGFHHVAGGAHAEVEALNGDGFAGATLYVTLEPCAHTGKQPPCVERVIASGVKRVVVGTLDPNPLTAGRGVARLAEAGVDVDVRDDFRCGRLIEDFAVWITRARPFLALKMAGSLDGRVTARRGTREDLTGKAWRERVERLRFRHQAVMIGAGTALIDDPRLVLDGVDRAVPFVRVIVAGMTPLRSDMNVFRAVDGYEKTVVLVPEAWDWRHALDGVADVVVVPGSSERAVDLVAALRLLREERGICSILCEGGPALAAHLIAEQVVDRFYWAIAPVVLASPQAVSVLEDSDFSIAGTRARFDGFEMVGEDIALTGTFDV